MRRSRTWSEAWACQPLGPNVSGDDTEIKVLSDGERKRLRAILRELERKQLKRAPAIPHSRSADATDILACFTH